MFYKYFIYPLLFSFTLALTGCAPKSGDETLKLCSINIIDRDGMSETICNNERVKKYENVDFTGPQPYLKVLRVYNRNSKGELPAIVTSYHENGQIRQYLEIVNGRASGTYEEWYPNGVMKIQATVIGGDADITQAAEKSWLFDGLSYVWDEEGNLLAEIPYVKGVQEGISTYYHSCGAVWKIEPYCKGEANGLYQVFLDNGDLLSTMEFVNGQPHGTGIRYWKPGQIAAEESYSEGQLLQGRYYDQCGKLIAEINDGVGTRALFGKDGVAELQNYQNGLLEGEMRVLDSKNRLVKIYHMKNGLKQGEEIEYYTRPDKAGKLMPKISVNWFDDKIQGIVKTWYDNGMMESQREMSTNIKNGLATAWYRDGNLMLIEDYNHGKLMKGEYYKRGEKVPVSLISSGKGLATLYDADGNFLRKVNYINGSPVD